MDLTARHDEVQRTAFAIDDRVDFRAAPATADTDRLILLPPLWMARPSPEPSWYS
jgi:hypothetical protein